MQAIFRFDGNDFKTEPSSNYPHSRVNVLGVFKGRPFVTGSHTGNVKTEILDYASEQWNVMADYPFSSESRYLLNSFCLIEIRFSLSYYATASTAESVFVIGGYTRDSSTGLRTPIIAEYRDNQWFNVGNLNQSRHGHGAITAGSLTMVLGGTSSDSNP